MSIQSAFRLLAFLAGFTAFYVPLRAQAPASIPYQAVARDNSGNLLRNQAIGLRFSIRADSAAGTVLYQETHSATTNTLGLFSVNIGQGTPLSGAFSAIDWGAGSRFAQVELDPAGGTAYANMGAFQLSSVPYALYAEKSGSAAAETDPQVSAATDGRVPRWTGSTLSDGSLYDDGTNVGLGTTAPSHLLHISGNTNSVLKLESSSGVGTWLTLQNNSVNGRTWNLISSGQDNSEGAGKLLFNDAAANTRMLINASGFIGIGTTAPAEKLDVNGKTKTTNFQMTTGAANGYVLQGDASGNAAWVAPTALSITESDPQVSASTTGRVPRWTGTTLSDGSLFDDGTNVGIGTSTPAEKLDVNGKTKTTNFQMTTGAINGYVLKSDASGNAAWAAPGSVFTDTDAQTLSLSGTTLSIAGGNAVDISQNRIRDADANTQVQVEASANEDKIRFDLGGTEKWVMTGSRLEPNNSGKSVFIGVSVGQNDDLNNNNAVGVGYAALSQNTTGVGNAAIGYVALRSNTTANYNSAFGIQALYANTTGSQNTGIGGFTLQNNTEGSQNTAVGSGALFNNETGSSNVAVGLNAGYINTSGSGNVFLGYQAGSTETGSNKLYIDNSNTSSPLIWGDFSSDYVNINGRLGIGTSTPAEKLDVNGKTKTTTFQMTTGAANGYFLQSDASGNASWAALTAQKLIQDADANTKVQVEETTNEDKIRFDLGGTEKWVMTGSRLEPTNSGNSVFIGIGAGNNDDLTDSQNVGIGYGVLYTNTTGEQNTALGNSAMFKNVSGNYNTALGSESLYSNTTGVSNTGLGAFCLQKNQTGNNNVALGTSAGYNNISGSGNVFLGSNAGISETGSNKLYIDNSGTTSPLIWGDFSSNYVNINGNLGIGTNAPTQAQLVVSGSESANIGGYGFINSSGNTGTSSGTHSYSIYANSRVAASEFNAHSDARIKRVRGRSDGRSDLNTLMGLQITDYTLRDTVANGSRPYKKVIAQQVEQVYPQAVNRLTDVVPDIYRTADIHQGRIALPNDLSAGDRVRLIFEKHTQIVPVIRADAAGFEVDLPDEGAVFVYGREVADFRTVDYEALSMLNVSATQELNRQIEDLKRQNAALQSRVQELEGLGKRIEALEALLTAGAAGASAGKDK